MKVFSVLAFALALKALGRVWARPEDQAAQNNEENSGDPAGQAETERQLPEELTLDNFDEVTAQALTLVEFYSPYCSHCKKLAPIWKKAYFLTEDDQQKSNIRMRQVNCIESGDLCARENIRFYPNLRLYAPENIEGLAPLLRFVDLYPDALARTPENFGKYLKSAVAEFDQSTLDMASLSEQMDMDLALKVVAGEAREPYFVALFLSSVDDWAGSRFPDSCLDCAKHRQAWHRVSNLVATSARTAHLNCHSHPLLCEKLGFPELGSRAKLLVPRYMMFVPKSAGMIRFDYKGPLSVKEMRAFVAKLATNYLYEDISTHGLEVVNVLKTELPQEPQDLYYPISNKMALVLAYDLETVTPEDKAILPYLLDTVTQLPFDISLAVCHSSNVQETLEKQAKGLTQYANSDKTFADIPFDRRLHLATSLSARPTLYIFKENSLIPAIYQNFALEDMRNAKKIEAFIRKNMYPLYGELTPRLYDNYFYKKGKRNGDNDKVVITFLNAGDATAIKHTLFNLSMVAHQYHVEKNRYYFEDLLQEREKKSQKVAKMKEEDSKTTEIIQQMRQLVPHLFDHDNVLFTYVDMVQYPDFARDYGLNIDGKEYKTGDTIVVSKHQKLYWDHDFTGAQLTSNRQVLREVLKYLVSPKLVPKETTLTSKLVGSPYHSRLRGADYVHQHGIFGYIFFALMMFLAFQVAKKLMRRPVNRRVGIIGNMFAKSD
ncbi:hypothetical protein METBIDRAFT_76535 [Metschnikowia bicuspidata var. bicuspidata NRRL YB-4993]|uniref:Thioredoxin domain-containing protein n=1 Tax=Metschnikowia bicuspidata var. bicuspidata NRRL YB-4993 TaxID=869754 RepID=A0A1A0HHQ1_9ASCO|nr:hypothetical protein METBIDRAFT_76535 [Metschnikowia bicuspidata var. bicuspidata NRRL YB-4993]OBA23535.1 hypothetical protein METBIDRAFT_76535 [Metschnikowia bicuspidata var. bicuspidata NRRL YB-4993]